MGRTVVRPTGAGGSPTATHEDQSAPRRGATDLGGNGRRSSTAWRTSSTTTARAGRGRTRMHRQDPRDLPAATCERAFARPACGPKRRYASEDIIWTIGNGRTVTALAPYKIPKPPSQSLGSARAVTGRPFRIVSRIMFKSRRAPWGPSSLSDAPGSAHQTHRTKPAVGGQKMEGRHGGCAGGRGGVGRERRPSQAPCRPE